MPSDKPVLFNCHTILYVSYCSSRIQCDLGYDMNHQKRGLALIFNNEKFEKMPPRIGTKKDEERLDNTFKKFGFKVEKYPNNNAAQIRDNLIKGKWILKVFMPIHASPITTKYRVYILYLSLVCFPSD